MSSLPDSNFLDGYNFDEVKARPQSLPLRVLKLGATITVGVVGILLVLFWRSMAMDPAPVAPTGLAGRAHLPPAQQAFLEYQQAKHQIISASPVSDLVTAEWMLRHLDYIDNPRAFEFLRKYEFDDEDLSLLHFRIEEHLNENASLYFFERPERAARDDWQQKLRNAVLKAKDRRAQSPATANTRGLSWEHIEELAKVLDIDRQQERESKFRGSNPALPLPNAAEKAETEKARLVEEQLRAKAGERAFAFVEQELKKPHNQRWQTKFMLNEP